MDFTDLSMKDHHFYHSSGFVPYRNEWIRSGNPDALKIALECIAWGTQRPRPHNLSGTWHSWDEADDWNDEIFAPPMSQADKEDILWFGTPMRLPENVNQP